MRAFVVVILCLAAPVAAAEAGSGPAAAVSEQQAERDNGADPSLQVRALASLAAGFAGGAGVLLSLPLAVPIIYLAALVGVPAAAGALPLLLVVPLFAALGSGGAALAFSEGVGPWVTGTLTGAAAALTVLVVGALVVPQRPSSLLDLHVGVLSVVVVPSLAAATTAAVAAPLFVSGASRTELE